MGKTLVSVDAERAERCSEWFGHYFNTEGLLPLGIYICSRLQQADEIISFVLSFGLLWEFSDLLCCQLGEIPPDRPINEKQQQEKGGKLPRWVYRTIHLKKKKNSIITTWLWLWSAQSAAAQSPCRLRWSSPPPWVWFLGCPGRWWRWHGAADPRRCWPGWWVGRSTGCPAPSQWSASEFASRPLPQTGPFHTGSGHTAGHSLRVTLETIIQKYTNIQYFHIVPNAFIYLNRTSSSFFNFLFYWNI